MMFPRTITLLVSESFSALPSKIRTFLNSVTATLGAAVAAPAASGLAGEDDTVAGGVVGAAPVAALPASDPDGASEWSAAGGEHERYHSAQKSDLTTHGSLLGESVRS